MKNDPEFNIEFIRLVEKYPVLYNYTLTGHSNKQEVEKTWNEIGILVNETGTACQEKWRILRGGFNRYIKKKEESSPGLPLKKPYYLAKYMDFLLPFLKSRSLTGNIKSPKSDTETTEDTERETIYDHCEVIYEGTDYDKCEYSNRKLWEHQYKTKFDNLWETYQCKVNDEPEIKKCKIQSEENPDLLFLKSLIPDMSRLDERNKIKFKIEVLNSLNKLLYIENPNIKEEDKNNI